MALKKIDEILFAGFVSFAKKESLSIASFQSKVSEFIPEVNESLIRNCPYLQIKGKYISLSEDGKNKQFLMYRKIYVLNQFAKNQLSLNEKDALKYILNAISMIDEYLLERFCVLTGHVHGKGPKGECCVIAEKTNFEKIVPLYKLAVNNSAIITYIKNEKGAMSARLQALGVTPGARLKLKQIFPAYILELEGGVIAIERDLARNIFVKLEK